MPATSKAQFRLMEAVKHNADFAKRAGIPQSVGREFTVGDSKPGVYARLPAHIHDARGGWIDDWIGKADTFPHTINYDSAARGYRWEHPFLGKGDKVHATPAAAASDVKDAIKALAKRATGGAVEAALAIARRAGGGGVRSSLMTQGLSPSEEMMHGHMRPAPTPYLGTTEHASQPYAPKIGHVGGLLSPVAGRTDHIPLDVPNGAYVLPADVISGLGEGNTIHGTEVAKHLFHTKVHVPKIHAGGGGHHHGRSAGGVSSGGPGDTVPIMAAGGEFVISPETVSSIGGGDMKHGHRILDEFVKKVRTNTIKTLKKLPGPVKR